MRTLAVILAVCSAVHIQALEPPELKVAKVTQAPPKIDGVLDDEAWKEASKAENFKLSDGAAPTGKCRMLLLQDDKNLYIAIECFEKEADLKKLKADVTEHDGELIWEDDDIELFIDPSGKRDYPYYQLIVNSKGTTWDAYMPAAGEPDLTWEPKYEAKVKVGKESWCVELALPWSCFNRTEKSATEWAFNVSHVRSAGELIYWSPVFSDNSHTPEKFGKLLDMPARKLK
ncbi:MAG: sugar-binding protein [Planctomycetota bacterium]